MKGKCWCGCGEKVKNPKRRYVSGHDAFHYVRKEGKAYNRRGRFNDQVAYNRPSLESTVANTKSSPQAASTGIQPAVGGIGEVQ